MWSWAAPAPGYVGHSDLIRTFVSVVDCSDFGKFPNRKLRCILRHTTGLNKT